MFSQRHYWVPSPCTDVLISDHPPGLDVPIERGEAVISNTKAPGVENRPAASSQGHQNRYVWKIVPNLNGTPENH
jgi:hypothetical protein